MISYLKYKNHKSKKNYKYSKTLTTILESLDTVVIIESSKICVSLSTPGFGLLELAISAGFASFLSLGEIVINRMILNN